MEQTSMTALVSTFARAYHNRHAQPKVYDDPLSALLLSEEEYQQVSAAMSAGVDFFCPGFSGTAEEALEHIVAKQLAPSPLSRDAFVQAVLAHEVRLGAGQYLLFGAGYDTFPYRQPHWAEGLTIFELDLPPMIQDKQTRLARAGINIPANVHYLEADLTADHWVTALTSHPAYQRDARSVCSLMGLTYYLTRDAFAGLLRAVGQMTPPGSSLLFDYPDGETCTDFAGERATMQRELAAEAGEPMEAVYSLPQLERLLEESGFLIYEHLTPAEITPRYFSAYNAAHPHCPIVAMDNVNYCHAVKKPY